MANQKYSDQERVASSRYSSIKQRVGSNIEEKWSKKDFIKWYLGKEKKCCYCGFDENEIAEFFNIVKSKRKTRGKTLEVERKQDGEYSKKNCELCCYWCNMAKSDVFTYGEFMSIGKTMRNVKLKILGKYSNKIRLPYEKTFFEIDKLISHIKKSNRLYIIIGGKHVSFSEHTKPKSLDFWLRENIAKSKNTSQISREFIQELCKTGIFKVKEKCICPDSGRRCLALELQKTSKKRQ